MLPNLINLKWDDRQVKLQIFANELAYKAAVCRKDFHQASQFRIMIDQLQQSLKQFQDMHYEDLAWKHNIAVTVNIHVGGQTREANYGTK